MWLRRAILVVGLTGCGRYGFTPTTTTDGATTTTSHLIGWWKLDETEGLIAVDSSGYGINGALTNFPTLPWQPTGGRIDGALAFDGVNDFVNVGKLAVLDVSVFTVALWVRGDADSSTSATYDVIKKHTSDTVDAATFSFSYSNASSAFQRACSVNTVPGSQWGIAKLTTQLVAGVWNHVTCSYDGSMVRAYANGTEEASMPVASVTSGISSLFIGARGNNGSSPNGYFPGLVDDVRIYDVALTDGEIRALLP